MDKTIFYSADDDDDGVGEANNNKNFVDDPRNRNIREERVQTVGGAQSDMYITAKSTKTTADAGGTCLKAGDTVKILSRFNLERTLPPGTKKKYVEILDKLEDKTALIHEISRSGRTMYIEVCISRRRIMTIISGESAVSLEEGKTLLLGDGSSARLGSLVQVSSKSKNEGFEVIDHEEEGFIGRTGKIIEILPNSTVQVRYGWGEISRFRLGALGQGSRANIEAQDRHQNWIRCGSLVLIDKSEFGNVTGIRIIPWDSSPSKPKTILVRCKRTLRNVSADSLDLIDRVKDRQGNDVRVGDQVQVTSDIAKLKLEQTDKPEFGGWVEDMAEVAGKMGKVTRLLVDDKPSNCAAAVMIRVQFQFKGLNSSYFLNPSVVEKVAEAGTGTGPSGAGANRVHETRTTGAEDDVCKLIDRRNLQCLKAIGKGGFGQVFRGEWFQNGGKKTVAIKVIGNSRFRSRSMSKVMGEAKILSSLVHPNIVTLFGVSIRGDVWIVMDLVDGTDLKTLLFPMPSTSRAVSYNIELSFPVKVNLCMDMCRAVSYIHKTKCVHRDIKPSNMMVDRSGKLYVCDFGISNYLGTNNKWDMDRVPDPDLDTQYTNHLAGTPHYIAPECLQIDPATLKYRKPELSADIWALGLVMYEVFSQQHLDTHWNWVRFLNDIQSSRSTDKVVKEKVIRNLLQSVSSIVSAALSFDPSARPHAQDLLDHFTNVTLLEEKAQD